MPQIDQKDLLIETALLKTLSNKNNYEMYSEYLDKKRLMETTKLLINDYARYFKLKPKQENVDFNEFFTLFSQKWHQKDLDEMDIEYYRDYVFPAITKVEYGEVVECIMTLIDRQSSAEIIEAAKTFDVTKIRELLLNREEKEHQLIGDDDNEGTIVDMDFSVLDKNKGIKYFLPALQANLGGMVAGQFILVSADTNLGKSIFVSNQIAYILRELNPSKPLIYLNSEGTKEDVMCRIFALVFDVEFETVVNDYQKYVDCFMSKYGKDMLRVFQITENNATMLINKVHKYDPGFVVIDIVDSLAADEDVKTLKKLYDKIRQLSNVHCPIMGTTQSGNLEYYDKRDEKLSRKKWLTMSDVLNCKAKVAAADTFIGIGGNPDNDNLRYLSVPKTKRGTSVNITCSLVKEKCQFIEIGW